MGLVWPFWFPCTLRPSSSWHAENGWNLWWSTPKAQGHRLHSSKSRVWGQPNYLISWGALAFWADAVPPSTVPPLCTIQNLPSILRCLHQIDVQRRRPHALLRQPPALVHQLRFPRVGASRSSGPPASRRCATVRRWKQALWCHFGPGNRQFCWFMFVWSGMLLWTGASWCIQLQDRRSEKECFQVEGRTMGQWSRVGWKHLLNSWPI